MGGCAAGALLLRNVAARAPAAEALIKAISRAATRRVHLFRGNSINARIGTTIAAHGIIQEATCDFHTSRINKSKGRWFLPGIDRLNRIYRGVIATLSVCLGIRCMMNAVVKEFNTGYGRVFWYRCGVGLE